METSWSITCIGLKKKQNSIVYHLIMEAVAAGVIILTHIPVKYNPADIMAKSLGYHQNYPLMK